MTKTHVLNPSSPLWDKIINTKTEAEWDRLMRFFDEVGITWSSTDKASDEHYWCKDTTVVYIWYKNKSLSWGSHKRPEETTIGVEEYIWMVSSFIRANSFDKSPLSMTFTVSSKTRKDTMLVSLTSFLEGSLSQVQKNYYKLGWIALESGELVVTSIGQRALAQITLVGDGDTAKYAAAQVKKLEAEAKKV